MDRHVNFVVSLGQISRNLSLSLSLSLLCGVLQGVCAQFEGVCVCVCVYSVRVHPVCMSVSIYTCVYVYR